MNKHPSVSFSVFKTAGGVQEIETGLEQDLISEEGEDVGDGAAGIPDAKAEVVGEARSWVVTEGVGETCDVVEGVGVLDVDGVDVAVGVGVGVGIVHAPHAWHI